MDRPSLETGGKLAKLYNIVDKINIDILDYGVNTVEYIGEKFQLTPGINDVAIAVHSEPEFELPEDIPRTFDGMKHLLEHLCCEGVIIEYKGVYWKIRQNVFTKKGSFELACKKWREPHKKIDTLVLIDELKLVLPKYYQ